MLLSTAIVACRSISNAEYMRRHGYAEEMLNGLLNLDLALECSGFVSSIASNWARWVLMTCYIVTAG
jgi:hypothetical protein